MPRNQPLTKGALALALASAVLASAAVTAPALADSAKFVPGMLSMDVGLHNSGAPQVVVRNVDASHQIGALDLAIQQTKVAFQAAAQVSCAGTVSENWKERRGYLLSEAAFGVGDSSFVLRKVILEHSTSIDHTSDSDIHLFQLPVGELADPQIGIDPVALVLAAAEQAPDKLQWLRQDHTLEVTIPLRVEGTCLAYTRLKVGKETIIESDIDGTQVSHRVREIAFKIKYQGDPQLTNLNPQIGQAQQPGGFDSGPQPLEITSAQFPHNMPHHQGVCPATKQFHVFYMGQGKGELRIRIAAGNTTLHESGVIAYDSKNHTQNYAFELDTPKGAALNNTIQHNLRVFVVARSTGEQGWPNDYQLMDQAVWKTRCTPGLNPLLGAGGGTGDSPGYAGNQQGGAKAKPLPILPQAAPQKPARKAIEPARPARQSVQ
jgi:hypothetical protein